MRKLGVIGLSHKTAPIEIRERVAFAEGEAKATNIQGQALRANPEILRLRTVEKWNGVLPQVEGANATPFVTLGK